MPVTPKPHKNTPLTFGECQEDSENQRHSEESITDAKAHIIDQGVERDGRKQQGPSQICGDAHGFLGHLEEVYFRKIVLAIRRPTRRNQCGDNEYKHEQIR